MKGIQLVRARYLERFCATLQNRSIDPTSFLERSGLSANLLDTPEAWIPLKQFLEFIGDAAAETGYLTLGLDAGIAPRKRHSKFSKLVLYSPTLYQTLQAISKNSSLEDTSARFRLVRGANLGWLECGTVSAPLEGIRQMEYYRYAALLEAIRYAAGQHWLPPQLEMASLQHTDVTASPLLRGVVIRYGQTGLKIAMESQILSRPMINVPQVPDTKAAFNDSPVDFARSLVEVVRTQLLAGKPVIEETATSLGMSKRTLQRRLLEQDMNYAALLNYVRTEMAKQWLEESDEAISDIAKRLAYSYSTHFSRAFARTCGMTPREYRRMHS